MPQHDLLRDLTIVLAAAISVVLVLHRLRVPVIAGFLVAGALLGPSGLSWVRDTERIEVLAEIGVVLLLFTIGLEFSLSSLRRMARMVCLGGALQVGLTLTATWALARAFGLSDERALFFGFLIALSSTAIVLRGLSERGELDAPHGRLIVGVLLFQDLCVVPMMLVVPMLATGETRAPEIAIAVAKSLSVMVIVFVAARFVLPRVFHLVARAGRRDVFFLAVVLACAAIAWGTASMGLSLALGAFLAGIVLADSEYGHQALADVLPLRDLFTSLFFVSVGMLLDLDLLRAEPLPVLGLGALLLLGKFFLAGVAVLVMRLPLRIALLSGLALAQIGEFSFVLADLGGDLGLITRRERALFLDASVLTMLITPLALRLGPHLAAGARKLERVERLLGLREAGDVAREATLTGHVVLLGFGVGGEMLAKALRAANLRYVIVELDAERIRGARAGHEPISYGDATSVDILERVRVRDASQVAVMLNDPDATLRAVRATARHAPHVPIVVRARYTADVKALFDAGATQVIAQEVAASTEVIDDVLARAGVDAHATAADKGELPTSVGS